MTMCAGCGSTFKNDYVTPFEVLDINQVLTKYGIDPPARLPIKATYHDPCHLMRGQDVKDEPRHYLAGGRSHRDAIHLLWIGRRVKAGVPEEAQPSAETTGRDPDDRGGDRDHLLPVLRVPYRKPLGQTVKNIMTVLLEGYRENKQLAGKKNE